MSKNIYQRMHAVMTDLQGVDLVRVNGLRFKIIQHDDVTAALRPLYLKHGIVQEVAVHESRQLEGGTTELLVRVTWVNIDDPKDRAGAMGIGHSTSEQKDKATGLMRRDDLGVGKALSYAVKMAQLKNFALLSGDGDLEQEQAKSEVKMATTAEVEHVLNMLASATDKMAFDTAARAAASIAGGLTSEQTAIMGKAWSVAKERVSNPQPPAPLPQELGGEDVRSTYEKITGDKHLDPTIVADLQIAYSKVRTREEFSTVRGKAAGYAKAMSAAQRQIMKEADDKASKLLEMQQQAAT